jgi:hypothetical protein
MDPVERALRDSTFTLQTHVVLHTDATPTVNCQSYYDGDNGGRTRRIAALSIEDYLKGLTIQGDPEVMLAFFDQARTVLAAEIGRTWPVEGAHRGAP